MRRDLHIRSGFTRLIVPAFGAALICAGVGALVLAPSSGAGGKVTGREISTKEIPTHEQAQSWDAGAIKGAVPNEVSHEFIVRNGSSQFVRLDSFDRSCSCTEFEPLFDTIAPGDTRRIRATLSLVDAGPRSTTVTAHWSDDITTTFRLSARAIVPVEINVTPRRLIAGSDGTAEAILTYICQSEGDSPGSPRIASDTEGLELSFDGWTQLGNGDPERLIASRYQANVRVSHTGSIKGPGVGFRIVVNEAQSPLLLFAPLE